jgi:hypothetical protein
MSLLLSIFFKRMAKISCPVFSRLPNEHEMKMSRASGQKYEGVRGMCMEFRENLLRLKAAAAAAPSFI